MNIERLRRLVEEGNIVGFSILGCCYLDGIDVDVDYDKAFRLLSAAAERRVPRAMYNLARMYAGGLGVEKSMSEAIRLYEAAARAGEFFAQIELARIYHDGIGIRKRPAAARKWYSVVAAWEGRIADFEELQEGEGAERVRVSKEGARSSHEGTRPNAFASEAALPAATQTIGASRRARRS